MVAEIIAGEVVLSPRPNDPHAGAQSNLSVLVAGPFRFGSDGGPGGWVFRVEPRIAFGGDIRVPDIAGWRRERFSAPRRGPIEVTPDWICEVLSQDSTAARDRGEKMPLYASHGLAHLWLVDPELTTLEVYRLLDGHWLLLETFVGDAKVRTEPFEAVAIDLSALWSERT